MSSADKEDLLQAPQRPTARVHFPYSPPRRRRVPCGIEWSLHKLWYTMLVGRVRYCVGVMFPMYFSLCFHVGKLPSAQPYKQMILFLYSSTFLSAMWRWWFFNLVSQVSSFYSWIGRPIRADKKIFPKKCNGYDNSQTTVGKLLAKRIQICFDYFCKINV